MVHCKECRYYYTDVLNLCPAEPGRELDASCNKLEALPPEIGKCSRLRKLRANGNYMEGIPAEVGLCALLEVRRETRGNISIKHVSTLCGTDPPMPSTDLQRPWYCIVCINRISLLESDKCAPGSTSVNDAPGEL